MRTSANALSATNRCSVFAGFGSTAELGLSECRVWPQLRTADMAERTVEVRVWLEAIVSQIATIDTDCISG